jgi:hypothetical protein
LLPHRRRITRSPRRRGRARSAIALEAACRELRRTKTFFPPIAEALELLREHEDRWDCKKGWISTLEDRLTKPKALTRQQGDDVTV